MTTTQPAGRAAADQRVENDAISFSAQVHRNLLGRYDVVGTAELQHQRFTVSVAAFVTVRRSAEIVTSVGDFGRFVDTVTCALVAPAATVMLLGTAAISG